MRKLELNLEKIKEAGKTNEDENFRFRIFLKGMDSDKVDRIVHKLNEELTTEIDCQECGNCCQSLRPTVSNAEIERLSKIESISKVDFMHKFVEKDDSEEDCKYLKAIPCQYLNDKSCTIYEDRPKDCRSYPHTHKKDFTSRTFEMIDNYEICPIVYNLVERLKAEVNFRFR
jgi:Fe-S-cluster containining protein